MPVSPLRARVNDFAKKPVKAEEVLVEFRVLLPQLLEPLRNDLLEYAAVDAVEILFNIDLDDRCFIAPLHASHPHIVLHIECSADRPLSVHTGK